MRIASLMASLIAVTACTESKREPVLPATSKVAEWAAVANAAGSGADSASFVKLRLQLTVIEGWYVYSLTQAKGGPTPMSVSVAPPYEIAGEISGPPPLKFQDPNFGMVTEKYSGQQFFDVPLKLANSRSLAPPPVEVKIRSQACSETLCLPARTTTLTVTPQRGST